MPIAPIKSTKAKGKERAFKRTVINVPRGNHDSEDSELGGDDLDAFEEFEAGASFLQSLDEKGISRCVFSPNCDAYSISISGASGRRIVCVA